MPIIFLYWALVCDNLINIERSLVLIDIGLKIPLTTGAFACFFGLSKNEMAKPAMSCW